MNGQIDVYPTDREELYTLLVSQLRALTEDEPLVIPNLSNAAALLWSGLDHINWAGFYLLSGDTLVLGPFQGQPACIRIPLGKGVCGTAALQDRVQCVPDVEAFPGHIACDSRSRSEIVVPLHFEGKVVGVLDIDSPRKENFGKADIDGLERFAAVLEKNCTWKDFRIL